MNETLKGLKETLVVMEKNLKDSMELIKEQPQYEKRLVTMIENLTERIDETEFCIHHLENKVR